MHRFAGFRFSPPRSRKLRDLCFPSDETRVPAAWFLLSRRVRAAATRRPPSSSNPSVSFTHWPKSQAFPSSSCRGRLTPIVAVSSAAMVRECFSLKRWIMRKPEEPSHLRKSLATPPTALARKSASRTMSPSNGACISRWKTRG